MNFFELLGILIAGHALADYPLQGDFLSKAKNHTNPIPGVPWYQALFAHSAIHAGVVGLITGSIWFAILEFIVHAITDRVKCEGHLTFNEDQAIHIMTKVIIALYFVL